MHRAASPLTLAYRGESLTFDMPGWCSGQSAEGMHTKEDMRASDRTLNRLEARAEGLLEPEAIRRIRERLGLIQQQAGELIGGGPWAFQRYGVGNLLPSQTFSSALRLLDRYPQALTVL